MEAVLMYKGGNRGEDKSWVRDKQPSSKGRNRSSASESRAPSALPHCGLSSPHHTVLYAHGPGSTAYTPTTDHHAHLYSPLQGAFITISFHFYLYTD